MEENSNTFEQGVPGNMDGHEGIMKDNPMDNNNVIIGEAENIASLSSDVTKTVDDHTDTSAQSPPPLPKTLPPMEDEENNEINPVVALETKPENNELSISMETSGNANVDTDVLALIEENKRAWSNLEEEFISKQPDNPNSSNLEGTESTLDNVNTGLHGLVQDNTGLVESNTGLVEGNEGLQEGDIGSVDVNMNQGAVELSHSLHNTDHSDVGGVTRKGT